jgi:hypothetical protein
MPRPRKSLDDQLAELRKKSDELEGRRSSLLARKKLANRKLDTRRKIVVGAAVLAHAQLSPTFAGQLREILDAGTTRSVDRGVIPDLLPRLAVRRRVKRSSGIEEAVDRSCGNADHCWP